MYYRIILCVQGTGKRLPMWSTKVGSRATVRLQLRGFRKQLGPLHGSFLEEARAVGQLRHERLVNFIRCCCGDERFLVAEYMPNDTSKASHPEREDLREVQ